MRQALQHSDMRVVSRGHTQEQLRQLAEKHFKTFESSFFLLIGNLAGSQTKFSTEVEAKLGIPDASLRHLHQYDDDRLGEVLNVATNPNCIGVVAFGLKDTQRDRLRSKLDDKGVGAIKDDPDGDSYAIFSTSKRIKPNELVKHLHKLLTLFFDKDHLE